MEQKYKIFSEKYNRMLDLVEMVDTNLTNKYKKVVSKLPVNIINQLSEDKDFTCDGTDYRIDYDKYDEMIEFQYTTYRKYFNVSMNIYPFYSDDLLEEKEDDKEVYVSPEIEDDEDGNLFIFSLTMTNAEDEAKIKINFEEKDGEYKYINTETNGMEMDYSVFIEKLENEEFQLISKYSFNGVEVYKKVIPISYEELLEYSMTEDDRIEYEQEWLEKHED